MKYGPEVVKEICDHIKNGLTKKDAAILSGITEQSIYDWINKYSSFSQSVKKAEVDAKNDMIKIIRLTAKGWKDKDTGKVTLPVWQAAAWMCERKYRDEFALRTEHTGAEGEKLFPVWLNQKPDGSTA